MTDDDADLHPVVRHHAIIAAVVSGMVLTVAVLAVCASCQQSRREQRRLGKLSSETPNQRFAAQLTNIDENRLPAAAQNQRAPGWTALINGGECIQRDDGCGAVSPALTASNNRPDTELPANNLAAAIDHRRVVSNTEPLAVCKHGGVSGPATANALISAVATIEKRPASPSTDASRESSTPTAHRPDTTVHRDRLHRAHAAESPRAVAAPVLAASPPRDGQRVRAGWSGSVGPVVAGFGPGRSTSETLTQPNCVQTVDRQRQRPASVRWTDAPVVTGRRSTAGTLAATRSTSQLCDDIRPRLGATQSIVF